MYIASVVSLQVNFFTPTGSTYLILIASRDLIISKVNCLIDMWPDLDNNDIKLNWQAY